MTKRKTYLLLPFFAFLLMALPMQIDAQTRVRTANSNKKVTTSVSTQQGRQARSRQSMNLQRKDVGGINIAAYPAGTTIRFNDKNYLTSLVIDSLAAGTYSFSFSKDGYASTDTTFTVREGMTSFYNVFLPVLTTKQAIAESRKLKADKKKKDKLIAAKETKPAKEAKPSKEVKPTKELAVVKETKAAKELKPTKTEKAGKKDNNGIKPAHPTNFLALAQAGYSGSGDPSYGLMLGVVKRNGFYVKAMSSFNSDFLTYSCSASGMVNTPEGPKSAFYKDGYNLQTLYISGGYVREIFKPLLVYVGSGYGKHKVVWTTISDVHVWNMDRSMNGVIAEGGLIFRIGKFAVSAGVQTVKFYTCEGHVGIGVSL